MFIIIGKGLLLNVDHIVSVNLNDTDKDGTPCIKLVLDNGTKWSVWSNLKESTETLLSITKLQEATSKLIQVKNLINKSRLGRESILSKQLKKIINE